MRTASSSKAIPQWLKALGYQRYESAQRVHKKNAHRPLKPVKAAKPLKVSHAYRREVDALLAEEMFSGDVAVFDVGQVPTVCFLDATGLVQGDHDWLTAVRQKIWNQGLVSLLLVVDGDQLIAYPMRAGLDGEAQKLRLWDASPSGHFSVQDVETGDIQQRHPAWFSLNDRVDKALLNSLKAGVLGLQKNANLDRDSAQFLLGQCLFVSYLEHRHIVSNAYRALRGVGRLHDLIKTGNSSGLAKLFRQLKRDFNGDFLEPSMATPEAAWDQLPREAYALLDVFLARTDIETGQQTFDGEEWHYDFRYIPVELISGIYETFLGDDKAGLGAYYTPRHLANLVVDQAFFTATDICEEVVYDGACGSGILLTTAFRRMICAKELAQGTELSFAGRSSLLLQSIRGGDLNKSACRLTAFSLYLSLLEDLQPQDIALLQEDENVKLPPLIGHTIFCGDRDGDFFSPTAKQVKDCTIFLSNPPWFEAKGSDLYPFEQWADAPRHSLPHRQIAAAFAYKSVQAVQTSARGGLVCLILPANLVTAPSNQAFLRDWLGIAKIERIINFSDCRRLLFAEAVHPCVVVLARPRSSETETHITARESVQYWAPKTDIGMVFGRLTVHRTDKHQLPAQEIWRDNQILRTYLWGGDHDVALLGKLTLMGTIKSLTRGKNPRWLAGCGFHHKDGEKSFPLAHLEQMPFLDAKRISHESPVLDLQALESLPPEIIRVASYGAKEGRLLKENGGFLLFPSGATPSLEIRCVFTPVQCSFKDTVRAIKAPVEDGDILRFVAMYLRSNLVRYFLMHTAYSLVAGRPKASLEEVENTPFLLPEQHPTPERARAIIQDVANITRRWESSSIFDQSQHAEAWKREAQELIFEYFSLSERDMALVHDACEVMIPSVQPSSYGSIRTRYFALPTESDLNTYSDWLMRELKRYRAQLGGVGALSIQTTTYRLASNEANPTGGKLGIVRITLAKRDKEPRVQQNDAAVTQLLERLEKEKLLPMKAMGDLYLSSDFFISAGDSLYLIKPLTKRLWMASQALRDAQIIVGEVQ